MKITIASIVLLTFPHGIQSLRFGLLRITESNDAGSTNKGLSSSADFRSLFDEDLAFNIRGLFDESLSFSLSMSFPLPRSTPNSISRKPTAVPTLLPPPTFTSPTSPPSPNSTISTEIDSTSNATVTTDIDSTSSTGGNIANSLTDTKKKSKNYAMIVVGSCALVAFMAIVAKKVSLSSQRPASALPKTASSTTTSCSSSSNEVSSVGSTSESDSNLTGNLNMNSVQL